MGSCRSELYFVFMNFDPEYERLRSHRTDEGAYNLDLYLSNKHDELLASMLEPGTYQKRFSLVIVDAFAVEITDDQGYRSSTSTAAQRRPQRIFSSLANTLRSAEGVRVVEKNQELAIA